MDSLQNNLTLTQAGMLREANRLKALQQQYLHPENADQKKLKKAAQEFEAVFLQQLIDEMDKTVDRSDSLFGNSSGEEYFRGMLHQEVAMSMSARIGGSGLGLAEAIYKQAAQLLPQHSQNNPVVDSTTSEVE